MQVEFFNFKINFFMKFIHFYSSQTADLFSLMVLFLLEDDTPYTKDFEFDLI